MDGLRLQGFTFKYLIPLTGYIMNKTSETHECNLYNNLKPIACILKIGVVHNGEFSLITQFVFSQKYVSAASGFNAMQLRINGTYGHTLLRAYFACLKF